MQLSTNDIVDLILEKFGIEPLAWLRKPRAMHAGWTNKRFIELLVEYETGPAIRAVENCGEQTVNRAFASLLVPITGKLHGGNETFKNKLFSLLEIRACSRCKGTYHFQYFDNDKTSAYGKVSICKSCASTKNSYYYINNKDRYHKVYIEKHKHEYKARNAKRRAAELQAIPAWADLEQIKAIYEYAEGAHVDHIIPLQGDTVCGLHVENNLQYLTPEENMSKGNKLLEEYTTSNFT